MALQMSNETWLYPEHVGAMSIGTAPAIVSDHPAIKHLSTAGDTPWSQLWACESPPLQLADLTKFDDDRLRSFGPFTTKSTTGDARDARNTRVHLFVYFYVAFWKLYTPPRTPPVDEAPLFPGIYSDYPRIHPSGPERGLVKENPEDVAQLVFPHPEQQELKTRLLRDVLDSIWWQQNQPEPKGIYSQFIRRINNKLFECLSCGKKLKRQDRTIDHFRTHVSHRPFRCDGRQGCGDRHCRLSFYTRDCLKSHCSKHEKDCDICGARVEDKNLIRHQGTRKCKQARRGRLQTH
ncbi:SubName: Full=Uncharacterized protein {ECO:0000313/EMBL:CCA68108.1} [Serendipita indica DSM 11827]|nr:SubName: Full=Uncharacterized protein {ECO:0000313/EMBL:CCA68108.1} [Serendipita indica DSM 11827]